MNYAVFLDGDNQAEEWELIAEFIERLAKRNTADIDQLAKGLAGRGFNLAQIEAIYSEGNV